MTIKTWTAVVEEDEDGNAILPFDKEMIDEMGWLEGDELDIHVSGPHTATIVNLSWQQRQARTVQVA